jgi:hypothetical protein
MRFSLALAALPALAVAQENPFEQYKAQFQNFLGQMGSYIPNPAAHDPVAALESKLGQLKLNILTLENWKDTLYESISPDTTKPEEWWVLTTGRNKTCYGHCDNIESAFNETAGKFALLPNSPHMALLNCEDQPILCNSWSAAVGSLYIVDLLPPPAQVDVYRKRLNFTTTTSDDLVAFRNDRSALKLEDGWFHPFNGKATELGLAVPFGYIVWAFNIVPNWLFMLVVSFASRSMMSRRMQPPPGRN